MELLMSKVHIDTIKDVFHRYNDVDVLEWGAGYSTIYFSNWLAKTGIKYRWTAVELNRIWFENVIAEVKHRPVNVRLFDYEINESSEAGFQEECKRLPCDEYVSYPLDIEKQYDVIIVDGRKRARCIQTAKKCLKENGVIILHDADRKYYHYACEGLNKTVVKDECGDQLWVMWK